MTTLKKQADTAVVFVHGIVGFNRLRYLWPSFQYFRGLRQALTNSRVTVYFADVPSAETINKRASVLADFLATIPETRVHIIAHSMGGLDSRYFIHNLDTEHRVRSLITIGTPHHGTPLVEWALETRGVLQFFIRSLTLPGLLELSPSKCVQFNETIIDRPDVIYRSYAGARPAHEVTRWFRKQTKFIEDVSGENDSQVSILSATWGEFVRVVRADHIELTGWSLAVPNRCYHRPFDHVAFYRSVIDDILQLSV